MAHVHGRPDNEGEWYDDLLGRGKGDPDAYGYPEQDVKPAGKKKASTPSTNLISDILTNQKCTGQKEKNL